VDDTTTMPEPADQDAAVAQFVDLYGRVTHLERVLAGLVGTLGPIQLRGSDYTAARPAELTQILPTGPDPDAPIVWAYPEHLSAGGLHTREDVVADAIAGRSNNDPHAMARIVLRALGLPTTEEAN
jgi:hypothetical protein